MREVDTGVDEVRMSAEEWAAKERIYREMGLDEADIATLRAKNGPVESGVAVLRNLSSGVFDIVAARRPFYERAAVYETTEVPPRDACPPG